MVLQSTRRTGRVTVATACIPCTQSCHTKSFACNVHLQPLKAASQEPAEMSDSKEDAVHGTKFEQFKKAVNEQQVEFMLVMRNRQQANA